MTYTYTNAEERFNENLKELYSKLEDTSSLIGVLIKDTQYSDEYKIRLFDLRIKLNELEFELLKFD